MSIYDRLGQVKSVAEYDQEAQALQGNKLQNMLRQAQFDEYGRKLQDDNALRQVVGGFGADDNANVQSLFRAGRLNEAQAYRKSITDAAETQAKTANQNSQATGHALEQKIKAHDFHLQQLGSLTDPSQIDAWAAQGVKDQVLGMQESMAGAAQMKQYAAQYGFQAAKDQAQKGGSAELQKLLQAREALAETSRHNAAGEGNQAAQLAEMQRTHKVNEGIAGAHLGLARQNTTNAMTKPFEVTGPDGTPVLVRQDKAGNISQVPGYGPKAGSAKPLTEAQGKDLGYGSRMREADQIIGNLTGKASPMAVNAKISAEGLPVIGGIAGPLANSMLGDDSQQSEQAQRDFANAVLRRESGAAISPSEFENARKQYFPQTGDGDAVLKQKAANRKLAIEGVMAAVPEGRRGSIGPQTSQTAAFSDADKERRYQAWKAQQGK